VYQWVDGPIGPCEKNLSMEMILKLKNRVKTIILEERNPHAIALIGGIVREDLDKGTMQL